MKQVEKQEIYTSIKDLLNQFIKEDDKVNSYLIRFHRLYLDGSYGTIESDKDGEKIYKLHISKFSKNLKEETLKAEALMTFRCFIVIEFFNREALLRVQELELLLRQGLGSEENYNIFIDHLVNNVKDFKEDHSSN